MVGGQRIEHVGGVVDREDFAALPDCAGGRPGDRSASSGDIQTR
jgi:hypothetical protein